MLMTFESERPISSSKDGEDPQVRVLLQQALTHRDGAAALAFLVRARHLVGLDTDQTGVACSLDAWWQQIDFYIDSHLESRIHIQTLAASIGLSVSHFHRIFRRHCGATPSAYIRERRVKRAQQLMQGRREKLIYIALACGFADQAHFSRVFKQVVGISPRSWRARGIFAAPQAV